MKNNIWSLKFLFGFDTISTSFLRVRCAWILLLAEENVDVYTSVHSTDNISAESTKKRSSCKTKMCHLKEKALSFIVASSYFLVKHT